MILYYQLINTPMGEMIAVASDSALVNLSFTDSDDYHTVISKLKAQAHLKHVSFHPVINQIALELEGYFHGALQSFETPIDFVIGTPFQQSVWRALYDLDYGARATYSDIAHIIQKPKSVRAVSSAIGQNPLSLIVPCHRVLRKDGKLGGFNSGIHRKKALLTMEANTDA
ncbi:methylated-DNA--[protein]-cysteine S-methyltransferase [Staphylococcus canis]|uniref:Methylated-DNA--[protein]-cysteine S-methyltransferase n=1 Tax=Staphylococcus canis TaxID=2724942 RepID=A0ABS0T7Q8_9STAP|nr:methylated-DNA--[protein]-cysteine S-methyltransferase [Staphylococcus canis]MBI5974785.1 methylated-DNA--[protein]-cysteine S-methyltransferase [Staphylococcus canis]